MPSFLTLLPIGLVLVAAAPAQLITAKEAPVAMGHHHLNVSDVEAHKKFWALLGATAAKLGDIEVMKLPNALILLRKQEPSGGTKGSSVDHIGFQVRDLNAIVTKLKTAGVPIVTRAEVSGNRAKGDLFFAASQETYLAFIMGPDQVKIELIENRSLSTPIANHHIHFATPDVEAMKAWHVRMFGAVPGRRGPFEESTLPGVRLTYLAAQDSPVGTKGRVLDHIGFEIKGLEAFCRKLASMGIVFDRPYQEIPTLGLSIAFFTDPWGNYIELTEGLDRL